MSETVAPGAKRTMMVGPSLLLTEAKVNSLAVVLYRPTGEHRALHDDRQRAGSCHIGERSRSEPGEKRH